MTQLSVTIEPPVDEAGATGEPGASTNLFGHFDGVDAAEPADGATVAPPVDEAAEAAAARERAAISASAIRPQTNYYDQFDSDPDAGEVTLEERMRLSAKDGYYRGTIAGAAELRRLVQAGRDSGWPADIKQQYESIVADLIRHDLLRPPNTSAEAAAVSSGQILAGASQANLGRVLLLLWRALRRLPGDVTPNDPSLRMPRDVPRPEMPADDPAPPPPAEDAAPPAHTPPAASDDAAPAGMPAEAALPRAMPPGPERYIERNGMPYVRLENGSADFGHISKDIAGVIGRESGAIRLPKGWHDPVTDKGEGEVHIEARHGNQIRQAGYRDVADLVADLGTNFNQIYRAGGKSLFIVQMNGKPKIAVIELVPDNGEWKVNTAAVYRKRFFKNRQKDLLWSRPGSGDSPP